MNILLRRRRLGHTSCNGISRESQIGIEVIKNDNIPDRVDNVFRWGCTSTINAEKVFNKAKAIHEVADKAGFRTRIDEYGIAPRLVNPNVLTNIEYPVLVRPRYHHQGRKFYLCPNEGDMLRALKTVKNGYVSEWWVKDREFRVYVVQSRIVAVAEKFVKDKSQPAWNNYHGGSFRNVKWGEWPIDMCLCALDGFSHSGLDYGGVDVIISRDGRVGVLEINSAPSLTSEYRQRVFARAFDYMLEHPEPFERITSARKWKTIIHPAIVNNANN